MNQHASDLHVPFWLKDNFAPLSEEVVNTSPEVIGQIPDDLSGRYFRTGPNPMYGPTGHWFLGNGMIHGIELKDGNANWVKSKLVQTPMLNADAGNDYFNMAMESLDNSVANTHIIGHAGKILALEELHYPYEMSPDLETVGAYDFNGTLKTAMTAHPKICGKTGELLFFAYGLVPPYLTYHRTSADGELLQSEEIEVGAATMVHDFNITENYVIFMDLPVMFDLSKGAQGGIPLEWSDTYGARLGVMPRNGSNADIVWYEIDPCYVFHTVNAYEEDNKIIIDVCRLAHMDDKRPSVDALLTRWTIDQGARTVVEKQLMDTPVEFPKIPAARVGQKHRFAYITHLHHKFPAGVGVLKYDFETDQVSEFKLPEGQYCGEPEFVPRKDASSEDDGYIVNYVYDEKSNKSEFIILDARNVESEPLARVRHKERIPFGFHGSWIAD